MKNNSKKFVSLRESFPWKQCHNAKVFFLRHLLAALDPDVNQIIGESVARELNNKMADFEIALLSIQAEIDESYGGGVLQRVPSVPALCQKVKEQTRELRMRRQREMKLKRILDVPDETYLIPRARYLMAMWDTRQGEYEQVKEAFAAGQRARQLSAESQSLLYQMVLHHENERRKDKKALYDNNYQEIE